jgi:hypothetical protein
MRPVCKLALFIILVSISFGLAARSDEPRPTVKETVVAGPNQVTLKVRMEGPITANVPLQVICYFKYTEAGAKRMFGAPVELDKQLGGVIGALRERGEFVGDELETILITPPKGAIKPTALLLIGLGDEAGLTLERMECVGKVALREASRLGARKTAFAPFIRDQGNSKIGTGEVERAVTRGMLLAYDTEQRLQREGLRKSFLLDEWWVEAGPEFFDETVAGVKKATTEVTDLIKTRVDKPYTSGK